MLRYLIYIYSLKPTDKNSTGIISDVIVFVFRIEFIQYNISIIVMSSIYLYILI